MEYSNKTALSVQDLELLAFPNLNDLEKPTSYWGCAV